MKRLLTGAVLLTAMLLFAALSVVAAPELRFAVEVSPGPTPTTNTLTFSLDYPYDNLHSSGCLPGATGNCVARFSFFEQVAGAPGPELVSLASTSGATVPQAGITATAVVPLLVAGSSHVYGVVAVTPDGIKSNPTFAAPVVPTSVQPNAATRLAVSVGP